MPTDSLTPPSLVRVTPDRRLPALIAALAVAVAPAAQAQESASTAGDWDIHRDEAGKSVMAYTVFSNGLGVAFRCLDGSFGAVLSGLPPAARRETRRTLRVGFGDRDAFNTMWTNTTDDTVAVADYPAMLAREFRQGGALRLTVPGGAGDGRNLQYAVELPPSSAAIDTVLTVCDRPLVDPHDAELDAIADSGLSQGVVWSRPPRPSFPARSRYAEGFVVTTCLTNPDGSLRDCQIEMQHPQDSEFGRATLHAIRRARIENSAGDDAPIPTVRVGFRTQFLMR